MGLVLVTRDAILHLPLEALGNTIGRSWRWELGLATLGALVQWSLCSWSIRRLVVWAGWIDSTHFDPDHLGESWLFGIHLRREVADYVRRDNDSHDPHSIVGDSRRRLSA